MESRSFQAASRSWQHLGKLRPRGGRRGIVPSPWWPGGEVWRQGTVTSSPSPQLPGPARPPRPSRGSSGCAPRSRPRCQPAPPRASGAHPAPPAPRPARTGRGCLSGAPTPCTRGAPLARPQHPGVLRAVDKRAAWHGAAHGAERSRACQGRGRWVGAAPPARPAPPNP